MAATIETIHQEIAEIKNDLDFIKHILAEDFELSDSAKKALKEARETPEAEYADLE